MRNIKKSIISIMVLTIMVLSSIGVNATTKPPKDYNNKWWCDGINWTYIKDNNPVTGFQTINFLHEDKLFYFDNTGNEVIGWFQNGDKWYYCSGERKPLSLGWQEIKDKWYYFNSVGEMQSNTVIDGYTIGADGAWIK